MFHTGCHFVLHDMLDIFTKKHVPLTDDHDLKPISRKFHFHFRKHDVPLKSNLNCNDPQHSSRTCCSTLTYIFIKETVTEIYPPTHSLLLIINLIHKIAKSLISIQVFIFSYSCSIKFTLIHIQKQEKFKKPRPLSFSCTQAFYTKITRNSQQQLEHGNI